MARAVFGPKDALKQVLITGATVSPDGRSVVYAKRTIEKGIARTRLWRVSIEGGRPERLTSAAVSDTEPRFSPDGRSILFTSDRRHDGDDPKTEPKGQLWILPAAGGEPRRLAPLPEGGSAGVWSPDGSRVLCRGGSGRQRFLVGKPERQVARRITEFSWRLDGEGIRDQFTSAWVLPARGGGKAVRVTAPEYEVAQAFWSPDGKRVGFLADRSEHAWYFEAPTPWSIAATGKGSPRPLADFSGLAIAATWSEAREVVFTGLPTREDPWRNVDLFVAEGASGSVRRRVHDETVSLDGMTWSELAPLITSTGPVALGDGRFLVLGHANGFTGAYVVDAGGRLTALTDRTLEIAGLVTGGDRLLAVACERGDAAELYELDPSTPGEARRITRDGARWFTSFHHAATEEVIVPRRRVRDLQGWLTRATGQRGRRPLVLHVHGGPYSVTGPTPLFGDLMLADAGFHVLAPNPAGSTGFGEDYARSLHGHWGVPDGADLIAAIEWAVAEGIADPDRIGVLGLSYGGFMVHHLLGAYPGRFRAAVSENPFTSAVADLGAGDSGHMMAEETGVGPWPRDPDGWLAISPAMRLHRNTAPLLLLQADGDLRCPPVHSEIAFAILRPRGVTVEMVRYPEESHIMLSTGRPDRRVDRLERIVGWFTEHL
jgi:dipeptidyl aminopeptidase/acylaminoacyl peptidase